MEAFPDLFEGDEDLFDEEFRLELQQKLGNIRDDEIEDIYEEGIIDDIDNDLYDKFCQELEDLEKETTQDDVSSMASFETAVTDVGSVEMNDLPEVYKKLFEGTNNHIQQFQETIQKTVSNMNEINFEEKKKELENLQSEVQALIKENHDSVEEEEEEEEETIVLLKEKQLEHISSEKEKEEDDDFSVLATIQDNFGIQLETPMLKPINKAQEEKAKEREAKRKQQLKEAKAKAEAEAIAKAKQREEELKLQAELRAMKEQQRRARQELRAQREALKRQRAEEQRRLAKEQRRAAEEAAHREAERQAKLAAEKAEEDRQFAIFCMQQEEQRMRDVLLAEKLDRIEAERLAKEKAERKEQERLKRIAYERMLEERRRKAEEERRRIERIREEKARQSRHEAYLKKLEMYAAQFLEQLVIKQKKKCMQQWRVLVAKREKEFSKRMERLRVQRNDQAANFKSLVRHLDTLSTAMPLDCKKQRIKRQSGKSIHDILATIKKVDHDATKHKAAMKIQRLFQKHRQGRKVTAAVQIQSFIRGYQCRKRQLPWILDHLRLRHLAATFIQKTWRGHRVRKALAAARNLDGLDFELETVDMDDLDLPSDILDDFSLDVSIPDDRYYNPTGYYTNTLEPPPSTSEPLKARSPNEQPEQPLRGNFGRSGYKSKFMKGKSNSTPIASSPPSSMAEPTPTKKRKKKKKKSTPNESESANTWGFTNDQTASAFAKWSKKRRGFKNKKKMRNKLKDPMVRLQRIQHKMPTSTKMFKTTRQPMQSNEEDDLEVMSVSSSGSIHDVPQSTVDQQQFRFPSIKARRT